MSCTLIIDHDALCIHNAALVQVGMRVIDDSSPATRETVEIFERSINSDRAKPGSFERFAQPDGSYPGVVLAFVSLFIQDGPLDHLAGLKMPVVRLLHPERIEDLFRLDLAEQPGVVVGSVQRAWMDGPQLRGDLHLIRNAPLTGWSDFAPRLLVLAALFPRALGVSIVGMPNQEGANSGFAVGCDLVDDPAMNRYGLFGDRLLRVEERGQRGCSIDGLDDIFRGLAAVFPPREAAGGRCVTGRGGGPSAPPLQGEVNDGASNAGDVGDAARP